MRTSDLLRMSLSNLARRKGRTTLTLAGVVIGVAAIVLLVSLGIGVKLEILRAFQDEDEIRILRITRSGGASKGRDKTDFSFFNLSMSALPISDEDILEIKKLPDVEGVMPNLNLFLKTSIDEDDDPRPVAVAGIPGGDASRFQKYLREGRLWASSDERTCLFPSALVEMMGPAVRKQADLIGRKIVLARNRTDDPPEPRTFTIAGILDSERMGMRGKEVLIPWERAIELRDLTKGGMMVPFGYEKGKYLTVEVRATSTDAVEALKNRLRNLNYQVISTADIIGMINTIFLVVEGFMGCVGAIGLIVALFGIANTMAMSVMERTREIGVMKAIGARMRDIQRIFLVEAMTIGLVGGVAGLVAGWIFSIALSWGIGASVGLPTHVRLFHVSAALAGGAVVFSVVVSVVAGWLPAARAARLQPVQALRYE